MQSLAYTNVLKRGFALVRDENNKPITLAGNVASGQAINIQFADGNINANAVGEGSAGSPPSTTSIDTKPAKPLKKTAKPKAPSKDQGSLF